MDGYADCYEIRELIEKQKNPKMIKFGVCYYHTLLKFEHYKDTDASSKEDCTGLWLLPVNDIKRLWCVSIYSIE